MAYFAVQPVVYLVAWILYCMSRAPEKIGRLFTLDMRLNLCLINILWLDPIPKIDA